MTLKKQIESLLFAGGKKMSIEELAKLTKSKIDNVKKALVELKTSYDDSDSSLQLMNEGDFWKLQVREQFLPLVRTIVAETELSKTVMETLAVIAFKYPIKQSELIKIRTNKAYDHLKELEEMGYITRQKHGRSNLIKLSQKFFEYFDLREEQLKEKFKDFRSIAEAIEGKEKEIETLRDRQKQEAAKEQTIEQKEATIQQEIESLDTYESPQGVQEVIEDAQKLGELEVIDEPEEIEIDAERERIKAIQEVEIKKQQEKEEEEKRLESEFSQANQALEQIVDEKVEELLNPKEESEETEESEEKPLPVKEAKEAEGEEPQDLLEAAMEATQKKKDQKDKGDKK